MTRVANFFFCFFSSRRRHTRCSRDWSSDVCSSDLECGCYKQHTQHHYIARAFLPHIAVPLPYDHVHQYTIEQVQAGECRPGPSKAEPVDSRKHQPHVDQTGGHLTTEKGRFIAAR